MTCIEGEVCRCCCFDSLTAKLTVVLSDDVLEMCIMEAAQPIEAVPFHWSFERQGLFVPDYEDLKTITALGKRFRQIALSRSQLWAYVSNSYSNDWNTLLIRRSRKSGLAVNVSNGLSQYGKEGVDFLLEAVTVEIHRVAYLRVQASDSDKLITKHGFLTLRAPILEAFVCDEVAPLANFSGPLFGGHSPRLTILDLHGVSLHPKKSTSSLRSLTSLTLSNLPTNDWPTCSDLLALLRNCEHVERLELRSAGPSIKDETNPVSSINLVALEELVIVYNETRSLRAVRKFLCHIKAEHLTAFALSCPMTTATEDNLTMIPRFLFPICNANHLCISYPALHAVRFHIKAPVSILNGGEHQEDRRIRISLFNMKSQSDPALGDILLSTIKAWEIASTRKINIAIRDDELCTLSPHPRQLLEQFSDVIALRLIGSGREVDIQYALHFVEACISMDEVSRIPSSFTHLQLDSISVSAPLKYLMQTFRYRRNQAGFRLYFWENGRQATW